MDTLTNHEKYMMGIPLNEELEKLARGEEESEPQSASVPQVNEGGIGRLTRTDLIALKELRQSDGWGVLQKLFKIIVQDSKDSAILMSEQDPGGTDAVDGWKIVAAIKRAYEVAGTNVDEIVKQLDGETKG